MPIPCLRLGAAGLSTALRERLISLGSAGLSVQCRRWAVPAQRAHTRNQDSPSGSASITTDHNFGFPTRGFSRSGDGAGPVGVGTYLGHLGVLDREDLEEALWRRRLCSFGLASDAEAE